MTTIGYAVLQIVPSLKGVSESINKQLAAERDMGKGAGKKLGQQLGDETASAMATHMQSAQNSQKLKNSLAYLGKYGDDAGREFARTMSTRIAQESKGTLSERLGAQVGSVIGKGIGGGISAGIKVGELALKGALLGAAGVASLALGGVGLALSKGFDRLKSIDQAKFKLQALGNDAASVSQIMDSALKSVKGTAFGMDEAVTAAASAVAAGIKPGQDLTKYLGEVGDAAAIAGTSFTDMGSIFNKIQTSNKAYTDDLQQLSDRGLPVFTWLQKEYGVTADALSKMVQNGEVDAAHFQHAIETNIGGAAQKMGQSFEGSVQNAEAALGRLGAALLAPVFGNAAGGIGSITDGLDNLTKWVTAHQPEIISFFTDMGITAVEVAQDIVKSFGQTLQGVGQFTNALGDVLDFFGIDNKFHTIGTSIEGIGDKLVATSNGFDAAKEKILGWGTAAAEAARNAQGAQGPVTGLGTALGALPFKKVIGVEVNTGDAEGKVRGIGTALGALPFKKNIELTVNGQVWANNGSTLPTLDGAAAKGPLDRWILGGNDPFNDPANAPKNPIRLVPHRASGGAIFGAGSATSDSIPALLSNGEHVWTTDEVNKAGGQGAMYRLRGLVKSGALRGFATGGGIQTRVPWDVDPHGGKDRGPSAGPFGPWWDMDWMPPERPENVSPGKGKWWSHGPTPGGKNQTGNFAPPIGRYRPPRPGDFVPGMFPNPQIKRWGFATGGGIFKNAQIPWPPGPIGPTGDGNGNIPDPSPGNYPGRIAVPDWSVPGQGWGPPPADWWTKPVNPDDVLFPDAVPPGKRKQQKEIWEKLHPRIKMLGFSGGGWVSSKPMGHVGRGVNAYDANKPTAGGNFNPNATIDTSTTSVAPRWDPNRLLFGDILKSIPGAYGPKDKNPYHPNLRYVLDGSRGSSIWGPGFAGGGAVGPDVAAAENLVGTPYSMAKRFDCSGDVARVINAALGMPGGDLMTTASASQWLTALGFKPGLGGPGAISVGWKNGGPGGGHMAMTLSDGRNAEGGGSHPNFLVGAGAAGASSAQFTDHMYLALAAASVANGAGQDTTGQGDSSAAPTGTSTAGSSSGAGPLPDSFSGLAGFGLSGLGAGVGTTKSGSDLSLFGNAAASAVGGQVDSALGVFGINGSPGWLKAATQLVGGLKVGGHDPSGASDGSIFNGANPLGGFGQGSAAPLSATSTATGTPPPDDAGNMHGTRAGQQPGTGPTYIINARDTEDAFVRAQRLEKEKAAAKLDRF